MHIFDAGLCCGFEKFETFRGFRVDRKIVSLQNQQSSELEACEIKQTPATVLSHFIAGFFVDDFDRK